MDDPAGLDRSHRYIGVMDDPGRVAVPIDEESDVVALLGCGIADAAGELSGRPVVVVRVHDRDQLARVAALVSTLPCVTVAVAERALPATPGFDVYLCEESGPPAPWVGCPEGVLDRTTRIVDAVIAGPRASLVLCQLLRFSGQLPVLDGLVAESLAYAALQGGREHRLWLERRDQRPVTPEPAAEEPPVLLERRGDELTITLHRPDIHNAFSAAMRDSLVEGLQVALVDPTITSVVLVGAGASFCSGGDLREFGTVGDPSLGHVVRTTRSPPYLLDQLATRCTARVHGACVGAGIELAAFAGMVTATPDARFELPEVGMGLIPGSGGTVSIPRRIGAARTAYLALAGTWLDAEEAASWGLIDDIL
jgi:hypothetical protein